MLLNHLNLSVSDVPLAQAFFEEFLGFRPQTKPSPVLVTLLDDHGLVLTLSNFDRVAAVQYPPHFHIGFIQPSPAAVDAFHQRLLAAGYHADPPRRFHGSWTFYFHAPGGVLVEILA